MKRRFNETIDGSIKNIIQLKTVNNSLEWSQMYDALEDCPVEFINKLIQTLNSLGETMGVDPTQTFDKVLCNVNDNNEETRKKLYNWWRGVFEVLGSCKNSIPKDREDEFNEKVDALMAEILKSGDGQNTAEEEPEEGAEEGGEEQVMLEEEYEPADKEDETNMLTGMKWAVGKIGEIANRVQELINFVNPYCGNSVNESGDQPKFKVGDVVRVMNVSGMDFHGRDAPIGPIVKIQPPHPDIGVYEYLIKGRSGEFFAYEDELELLPERFTEENDVMSKPARYSIGDKVLYKGEEYVVTDIDEDLRNDEEIYQVSRDSDKVDGLSFNSWATWDELELINGFEKEDKSNMKRNKTIWKEIRQTSQDDWVDAGEVFEMAKESDLENELDKGDDGWVEIGQPVGESKPVELESGATKKVSLYVDWDDDGAGLDRNVVIDVPSEIADSEESTALYDYIMDWIDHQDFCVNDWVITDIEGLDKIDEGSEGEEQKKKPEEVKSDEVKKPADVKDGEKQVTQDGETKTLVAGEENKKPVCEMTIEQEIDNPWKLAELLWGQGKENLEELLRQEGVDEDYLMQVLEDYDVHNLTQINDLFAYDFETVLDSMGFDPEVWSQNLEFVKRA